MSNVQEAARTLADIVSSMLKSKKEKLGFSNIPGLVTRAMEVAQQMSELSGEEKKEAVTKAICLAIDRSDAAGPLEGAVLELVPKLCDAVIEVDKGKLVINKKLRSSIISRFGCCK